MHQVIAICGNKCSGKDTLANYICAKYDYKNVKFAGPLKEALKSLFGFTNSQMETDKEVIDPFWQTTPRKVMQFIGTEVMQYKLQELLPDIERTFFARRLVSCYPTDKIVISDLRFTHEYETIKKAYNDIQIIKIIRNTQQTDMHISENEISTIPHDVLLINNGTKEELYAQFEKSIC